MRYALVQTDLSSPTIVTQKSSQLNALLCELLALNQILRYLRRSTINQLGGSGYISMIFVAANLKWIDLDRLRLSQFPIYLTKMTSSLQEY